MYSASDAEKPWFAFALLIMPIVHVWSRSHVTGVHSATQCKFEATKVKNLEGMSSFKVARNEVENASFAQRSAHRDSRI